MALRELAFCSVPWPAMNSVVSDWLGRAREGKLFHDFVGAGKNDFGHRIVRADGAAVKQVDELMS